MKTWVKGLLLGFSIGILYFLLILVTFLLASDPSESTGITASIGILNMILVTPFYFIFFPIRDYILSFTKLFLTIIVAFSIIGTVIGMIIQKYKNSNGDIKDEKK